MILIIQKKTHLQVPSIIVMPPLGIATSNAIQPGQVGGGAIPASNPFASSLAPDGNFNLSFNL